MAVGHLRLPPSRTATQTSVASSLSSVELLAVNTQRVGVTVWNDSRTRLYISVDGAAASLTNAFMRLEAGDSVEVPFGFKGQMFGIWPHGASGFARVAEWLP